MERTKEQTRVRVNITRASSLNAMVERMIYEGCPHTEQRPFKLSLGLTRADARKRREGIIKQ